MDIPNGSSINVLMSEDLSMIATGYESPGRSRRAGVRKLFGGSVSHEDMAPNRTLRDIALACVIRETCEEAGITRSDFEILNWVGEPRVYYRTGESVFQFAFLSIARAGLVLPVAADGELSDRRFITIPDLLTSWRLSKKNPVRFNPYHAIAVAKALQFLRTLTGGDERFAVFHELIAFVLPRSGVHIDLLPKEIDDAIQAGLV